MTYSKAIEIALQKVDGVSGDYDPSIFPAIADAAQKAIALFGKHIKRVHSIVKENTAKTVYNMPAGFYKLLRIKLRGSIKSVDYYEYSEGTEYKLVIGGEGTFDVYYYAMPITIDENTPDTYEFEVDLETHNAIPYFIGYEIAKNDDAAVAQICSNEWDKYMSLFEDKPKAEQKKIINRYEVR